jgi:hypothetical protein
MGPREVLIKRAVGFISANSAAPINPRERSLNTRWIDTTSERRSNSSFDTSAAPAAAACLGSEILAPCNDLHAERRSDAGHFRSQIPEADDAQCFARQVIADGALPSTAADSPGFRDEVTRAGQDQAPSQFNRRAAEISGVRDFDAALSGGFKIDGSVARTGRGNELEIRQLFDALAPQRRALAHYAEDVVGQQSLDYGGGVGEVIPEHIDLRALRDLGPVGQLECDPLIIVQHRYLYLHMVS